MSDPLVDIGGMHVRASHITSVRRWLGRYVIVGIAGGRDVQIKTSSSDDAESLADHIVRECNGNG